MALFLAQPRGSRRLFIIGTSSSVDLSKVSSPCAAQKINNQRIISYSAVGDLIKTYNLFLNKAWSQWEHVDFINLFVNIYLSAMIIFSLVIFIYIVYILALPEEPAVKSVATFYSIPTHCAQIFIILLLIAHTRPVSSAFWDEPKASINKL